MVTVYTIEEDTFLVEAYFRTGVLMKKVWKYNTTDCILLFREKFPRVTASYRTLHQHVMRIVKRFQKTGSVARQKSTGRPRISIEDMCTIRIVSNKEGNRKIIKKE